MNAALASLAELIAAFETGSGLSVRVLSVAFSLLGAGTVIGLCAWSVIEHMKDGGTGRLSPFLVYWRAFVAACVMAGCVAMFSSSSPLST